MSLYSNLLTVLTPYANKIKQNEIDIRTAMSLSGGAPIVVGSTSAMTDTDQIYVLSTDGNWYYHNGTAWTVGGEYGVADGSVTTYKLADGAVTTAKIADGAITAGKIASGVVPVVDSTLTQTGAAADAKATSDALSALEDQFTEETDQLKADLGRSGLSQNARAALLACLEHVAWIDEHGQTYYNALKDALYPNRYWDYEWDATSGVAPSSYFSSYEHDFTKYPDAMYADNFYFDFDHVGDADILFVAKMTTEASASDASYRTPQISVRSAQGSNGYDGFKVVFKTPSGKVETNLSGDFVSTDIDYTNYHEYRVKYENGVGYLYVDGILVAQGAGVTNSQYIYMTGIFASVMGANGHPDISDSILHSKMAIKSVKYKGLS